MNLPNGDYSELDMRAIEPFLKSLNGKDQYLEVGVKHGKSLAYAAKESMAKVTGVDIEDTLDHEWFDKNLPNRVEYLTGGSDVESAKWNKPLKLLFIDGDHTYEGVGKDWNNWAGFVRMGGVVFFHDCDETSPGVVDIANEIAGKNGWSKLTLYKKTIGNTSMGMVRREK